MSTNEETNIDNTGEEQEIDLDFEIDEEETKEEEVKEVKKPTETLEARKARLERQLAQTNKKLGVNTEKKEVQSQPNDLGEAAFLIANGLRESDERQLAKRLQKETGRDLESLLDSKYFKDELEMHRSSKSVPKSNQKGNPLNTDSVDYWLAKNDLPPQSEVELRRKVVNARIKKESNDSVFYNS